MAVTGMQALPGSTICVCVPVSAPKLSCPFVMKKRTVTPCACELDDEDDEDEAACGLNSSSGVGWCTGCSVSAGRVSATTCVCVRT